MPIDTSIYGNIRQFQMPDPMDQAAKGFQIRAAQQQIANSELQGERARREFTLEDDISGALSESGGDLAKASALLAARGRGTAALTLGDKAATRRKTEVEEKLKLAEAIGSDGIALDAAYREALTKAGGDAAAATAAVQPIYSQVRARWKGLGQELPEAFDPVGNLAGIGQAKEVTAYLKGMKLEPSALGRLLAERDQLPANDPRRANYDDAIGKQTSDPTELARLMMERNKLPEGDPRRATYDRVLTSYKAGRGGVEINSPLVGSPMTPGKTAAGKIDEGVLDATKGLMQLDTIAGQFKPEYQTLATRGANWWSSVKEKAGADLKVKEKADLEDFSKYKRNAIDSLNQYIQRITGAAMSEQEAQRILRGMPNPGQGLFDGDSPTEFKAKLDDAMKQTRMAVARGAYLKRQGMSLEDGLGKGVTIDRMPALMNERGRELEAKFKQEQPNVDGKALGRAVRRQLSIEFGLSSD